MVKTDKQKMAATLTLNGKHYEITGYAADGLPIIQGKATSTQDGFDQDGNPKISVEVKVPSIKIGVKPGEVK